MKVCKKILLAGAVSTALAASAFAGEPCKGGTCNLQDLKAATSSTQDKWSFLPPTVITVGDTKIDKAEFIKEAETLIAATGMPPQMMTPAQLKQYAPKIADGIVNKIIFLKLAKASGITPTPQLVINEMDEMLKTTSPQELEQLKQGLSKEGKTLDAYKKELSSDKGIQERAAINKWIQDKLLAKIKISDEAVKSFYENNGNYFEKPDTVTASHILIKPKDDSPEAKQAAKEKAAKILADLKKGTINFEETAEKESACPSGKSAKGSLGEFPKGAMLPEFEKVAFTLPVGKLSDLTETKYGYHIIKVTDKSPAGKVALDKVKDRIKQQLENQALKKEMDALVIKEKAKLDVSVKI